MQTLSHEGPRVLRLEVYSYENVDQCKKPFKRCCCPQPGHDREVSPLCHIWHVLSPITPFLFILLGTQLLCFIPASQSGQGGRALLLPINTQSVRPGGRIASANFGSSVVVLVSAGG